MAAAGTYYIDTINFADANEVFLDEALTTCAPNGFYQMGGATAREQVDCVNGVGGRLLDAEACPSCTPPAVDPPIAANTSYKVTDVVTSAIAFVAITNTYQPTQKITTNLSANCWLINNGSTDAITATITGPCNPQFVAQPLYFLLDSCSGVGSVYTYIVDPSTNTPPTDARYEDINTSLFYVYQNAPGVVIPIGGIPIISTLSQSGTGCPVAPTEFSYWNATPCSGGSSVTIKSNNPPNSDGTTFTEGTTSVKVSGTCYVINNFLQTTSAAVSNIGVYAGTAYTACQTGANPCIPAVVATPSFDVVETTSGATNRVTKRNLFSQNDNIVITGLAGCWKLVSPSTVPTSNTIQDFCPTVAACATYIVTGSGTFNRCSDGSQESRDFTTEPNQQGEICARLGTESFPGGSTQTGTCSQDIAPPSPYDFWLMRACSGGNVDIRIRTTNKSIVTGNVMKLDTAGNPCYTAQIQVGGSSFTASTSSGPFSSCNDCAPVAGPCYGLPLIFNSTTDVCPTGPTTVYFSDTTDLATATKLYQPNSSCLSSEYADNGTYNNGTISRYWQNGSFQGASADCGTPSTVRATITDIVLNIDGPTAGFDLTGIGIGSYVEGVPGFNVKDAFTADSNPRILINTGYSKVGTMDFVYNPSTISSDQGVILTITGEVVQDTSSFVYAVTGCGTPEFFRISHNQALTSGTVILFRTNGGLTRCGTVGLTTTALSQGSVIQVIPSSGCLNNQCFGQGSSFN